MARPEGPTRDAILDAARRLVLDGGPASATVPAVALASGAAPPALYRLFASREQMLARLWIRAAQRSQSAFLTALASKTDPIDAAVAAGLSVFDFVAASPDDARLLVCVRRENLFVVGSTPGLPLELERLNQPMVAALANLAERMTGEAGRAVMDSLALATVDIPHGAVRRHLSEDQQPPPARLRRALEIAIRGALDTIEPSRFESKDGRAALRIV
jgi:AcrR family transcriptional regulator